MILQIPVLFCALLIDRIFGDPKTSLHPVALIGRFIGWWGRPERYSPGLQRGIGVVGWLSTVCVFTVPFALFQIVAPWYIYLIGAPVLLKFCFAWRALEEHAEAVVCAASEEERALQASLLVSRNTSLLTEEQTLSAAFESVAENLNDSIIAPLFWFLILGLPGAAIYRAVNTMDAMLGYTDERKRLGWCAARMDDIFSYIPARICGLVLIIIYSLKGRFRPAYNTLLRDRKKRPGLNGGIPMSLIAGGEGILFEKPNVYRIGEQITTLRNAGPSIIRTVRLSTLLFCLFGAIALVLLDGAPNIYGI
ncbi:adenosylcobinamide-phosphate synthase CbiB [Methanospirillum sp.]|uniref:adenosylcobinamide-phosphate synthase CbiB n=1 Tax=Methanospirillum sp. TaxID=45200 RepID=UPI002B66F119|nr:adenosylcobinamide-phosphate synthase CbiB [Methanospirillum sp.]HPP77049.1 adenosylcobinamide-phosphate synthase CbiB [Methanospirillum sp.]